MSEIANNETVKAIIQDIEKRVQDKILEPTNAELLKKLISNAESLNEAISIAELGTSYKRTGLHFDKRLEKMSNDIRYFKKNEKLSFHTDDAKPINKLIIGDNYEALQNLLIQYRGMIDVIYIDPPYGKDSMGQFADTNYENAVTRDNLLSMLYPRLILAKQLLSSDGVIFCSIDDRNQAYVKCLFDEIFGETSFLLNVPRITKKGGKTTTTIAKNNDYILAYCASQIQFSQEEKTDLQKYKYEDEFVETRGKYSLTQTLDYDSLQYSQNMDYVINFEGRKFVAGGSEEKRNQRLKGFHGKKDWIWRWNKEAFEWGVKEKLFVLKGDRIYTKSYLNCRKKSGKCELEEIDATKAFTTLSYLDNKYSNDNAKKELDGLFENGNTLFRNPKPTILTETLIKMVAPDKTNAKVLDFFAGSGTTGHAVLDMNEKDGGERTFILCQVNEITETNPNGIAIDVTTKRLKRVMTGECYDGSKDFKWAQENEPYGGNLEVYEIDSVSNFESSKDKTPFDVIDETLYGENKFQTLQEKVEWVCRNFRNTQKVLEEK
ncbi:MAG: site-specific DNA-methyltransferase [Lachnospiraceae bacterium]|nr:site-specific DNA-methyltransferase [Lachnospiraceae bacterium]MCQ2100326.1 site-specific DNA-methyltransferase [Fibrobacter sp.]